MSDAGGGGQQGKNFDFSQFLSNMKMQRQEGGDEPALPPASNPPGGVPNAGGGNTGKIVAPDLQLSPHTGKLGAPSSNTQQRPPANPPAGPPKNIPLGPNLRAMPVMQAPPDISYEPVQSLPPSAPAWTNSTIAPPPPLLGGGQKAAPPPLMGQTPAAPPLPLMGSGPAPPPLMGSGPAPPPLMGQPGVPPPLPDALQPSRTPLPLPETPAAAGWSEAAPAWDSTEEATWPAQPAWQTGGDEWAPESQPLPGWDDQPSAWPNTPAPTWNETTQQWDESPTAQLPDWHGNMPAAAWPAATPEAPWSAEAPQTQAEWKPETAAWDTPAATPTWDTPVPAAGPGWDTPAAPAPAAWNAPAQASPAPQAPPAAPAWGTPPPVAPAPAPAAAWTPPAAAPPVAPAPPAPVPVAVAPVTPTGSPLKMAPSTRARSADEALSLLVRPNLSMRLLLDHLIELGASDLHLSSGVPPCLRLKGDIQSTGVDPLLPEEVERMLLPIMSPEQQKVFAETNDIDFAIEITNVARFRVNFSRQYRGMSCVMRIIPKDIPRLDQLNLPAVIAKIAKTRRGLVIVTGPTGSGKSTTLAAMLREINLTRQAHIITIEDPIEFVHESAKCLITHREVGTHATSFADAIRAAVREDPDIILVGEMRDLDTVSQAVRAAEMGMLVLATLHTNNASKAVDRIIDIFPAEDQEQIRITLSEGLKAVVAQQLLKRQDGQGRIAVHEVLIGSPALSNLIREAKTHQIPSVIQTGRDQGMQLMDQGLIDLIQKGLISPEQAREKATDLRNFQRAGIHLE